MPGCATHTCFRPFEEDRVAPFSAPIPLRRLHLPLGGGSGEYLDTITKIVNASAATLRHLDLGSSREMHSSLAPAFTLSDLSAIVSDAPRLHTFKSGSTIFFEASPPVCHHLTPVLSALRDIRILSLGISGYDISTIFSLLLPLQHLYALTITVEHVGPLSPVHVSKRYLQLSAPDAVVFIEEAPALEWLTLPKPVRITWEDRGTLRDVKKAGRDNGVHVRFSEK
jgi:hypothetical protein